MIRIYDPNDRTADLFGLASPETVLVSPVDCTGAQGAGLALAFKKKWPHACAWFKDEAAAEKVAPGRLHFFIAKDGPTILFFPTKRIWQESSTLEVVAAGLEALPKITFPRHLRRIGIPALGCGEGRLTWNDVLPLLKTTAQALEADDFEVHLFPPQFWRDRPQVRARRAARRT